MKVVLKLELFGEDTRQQLNMWRNITDSLIPGLGRATFGSYPPSSWVAEITGLDPKYKFARTFLKGQTDYSESNSVGSRGVFRYFVLDEGRIYDVKSQETWKRAERYYCTVREGKIIELDENEVRECLNAHSA